MRAYTSVAADQTYKGGQKDEVDRSVPPLDVQGDEQPHGEEEGHHDEPRVGVDGLLQGGREQAAGGDQRRQRQLHREEAVHLAQKALEFLLLTPG